MRSFCFWGWRVLIYIKESTDVINILRYINEFTKNVGIADAQVDSEALLQVCVSMRQEFPHIDGLEKASTFKKVANFVAWFVYLAPIKSTLPSGCVRGIDSSINPNSVVAFDIALHCLQNSTICANDGDKEVANPLYVSDHSYADIIDALSRDVQPKTHYHLLAVLFEQITYKSNPHCEYQKGEENVYYPKVYDLPQDDMAGV